MTGVLSADLSHLLAIRRTLSDTQALVTAGQNVLVLASSDARARTLTDMLGGWLFDQRLNYCELDVPFSRPGCAELSETFSVPTSPDKPLEHVLLDAARSGTHAVLLRSRTNGQGAEWQLTCNVLQQWARLYKASEHIPTFCGVLLRPERTVLPSVDANLRILWAHNFESAMDVSLLCRENSDNEDVLRGAYREHVLPSITGPDVELADHLWIRVYDADVSILEGCREYATSRGWKEHDVRNALKTLTNLRGPFFLATQLPAAFQDSWLSGHLQWSPEYGVELHAGAQALLNRGHQIRRRMWRGQVTLVLHLLNQLRVSICDYLTTKYGPAWPARSPVAEEEERAELRESALNCQLGHLCRVLRGLRWSGDAVVSSLYFLSISLRDLRNELAHYRPITYGDLSELRRLATESGTWSDHFGC